MSEPTSPEGTVGRPERLHPFFLLSGFGGSLRGLAGGYAFIAYLLVSGQWGTALVVGLGLLAVMLGGIILYWTRFEYRVGSDEIRIDSGILSRRHRSIPFDRVHDVDITQGPLARLLGIAAVKFETGSGGGPDAEEGALHAIRLERALEIRELVRSGRRAEEHSEAAGQAQELTVYAMSPRRLLLAGVFNFSLAVFAGLFGATQTFGDAFGFDPLKEQFWGQVLSAGTPLADYVLQHRVAAAVAGALLFVLIGLLTGITRTVLRDWGFRLERSANGLRRRRGLITRTDVTVPVRRGQAVVIRSGPVRERFGWSEIRLQSLARDEDGSGDHVLAPLASDKEVAAIVQELGWRPVPTDAKWRGISAAYVWTLLIALTPFYLLTLGLGVVLTWTWVELPMSIRPYVWRDLLPLMVTFLIFFVGLIIITASRVLAWRRTAFARDGDRLLLRGGWWRRRLVVLPAAKVQSVDVGENFISRLFGTATLRFGVAGASARGHLIPAIPTAEARQLRGELLSIAS